MRKLFIIFCLSFSAIQGHSQFYEGDSLEYVDEDTSIESEVPRVRKYPARLWEITGNGLKQPSYLYGTMHVSKKLAFNLGDTFYKALQSVDVVALELTIDSWLSNIGRNSNDYYFGFNKYGRYDYGYGSFYRNAIKFDGTKLTGLLAELGSEDYMSNFLLYRQGYQSPDYSEKTYVDLYIHQVGKKLNKYCTGLEDFEISRRMVNRSEWRERTFPRERDYSNYYYDYEYGEDPSEKAYREGDLDMIDSLEKRDNPDVHFLKWMLYERNKVMADQIEEITKTKRLFAAVGCAHLPGDSGVIEYLRMKGFTLKPIYDNIGDYAFKSKQKLETTITPVTFKKFTSHTGELSFELPGTPLDRSFSNTEEIFYADVANGAYYVLKKMPYYGTIKGISQDKLLKQIDSALYENIPGDITSRSKTTLNGFPAIDVSNRTKTGETQRHMYIIMPNDVWYIKLSAAGDYAEGKEARDFFKSISLQPTTPQWTTYSPEAGGYKLNWPVPVVQNKVSFDTSTNLKGHISLEYTDNKKNFYFLRAVSVPYYGYDEDTFHMHQIANNYAYYQGGKVEELEFRSINGHKAMQTSIRMKDKDVYLHMLMAVDADNYYTLGVFSESKKAPSDFLNSFEFTSFNYKYLPVKDFDPIAQIAYKRPDWKTIKDQHKLFLEESEIAHKEIKYPEYGYGYNSLHDYFKDSLMYDSKYIYPITFPSGESVDISYYTPGKIATESNFKEWEKHGILIGDSISITRYRFYADSMEHHWDSIDAKTNTISYRYDVENNDLLDTIYYLNGMVFSETIQQVPGTSWIHYNKTATGEFIQYNIATRYDQTRGMSPVVKDVLNSVEYVNPKNPMLDSAAFGDLFVKLLSSADSIDLFKAADYRYYIYTLPKSFNDTLMKLMLKFDKNKLYGKTYTESIEGKLMFDAHLPLIGYYMDKYRKGGDTSEIQASMLGNLGRLKNAQAVDSLMFWLLEETPLAPENSYNSYIYSGIIYTAYDTLELWKDRFVKLLPLTRYTEYEDAIMSLGLTLLDSNMIDSTVFEPLVPELTLSFRDDLKRKMAKSANTGYNYRNNYSNSYGSYADPENYEYGTYNNNLFGSRQYGADYESAAPAEYYEGEEYHLGSNLNWNKSNSFLTVNSIGYPAYAPLSAYGGYSSGSNTLYDKARLLVKFIKTDPDVAKRLYRVYSLTDKVEKMQFINLYLKSGIVLPDTMFGHYLKEKDCQYGFIQMLKNYKMNDSIPANHFDEKNLANSFVYYHHFEKKDTVVFLGKKSAPIESEEGNMYFYKHKNKEDKSDKKDEKWQYSYVWYGAKDTLNVMKIPRYFRFDNELNKKQSVKDMMNTEVSKLQYWKHPIWEALVPEEEEKEVSPGWGFE